MLVKKRREDFLKHDKERRKLLMANQKVQQKKLDQMEHQIVSKMKKIEIKEKELESAAAEGNTFSEWETKD